jgi:Gpi18-like mannosyltransferase
VAYLTLRKPVYFLFSPSGFLFQAINTPSLFQTFQTLKQLFYDQKAIAATISHGLAVAT